MEKEIARRVRFLICALITGRRFDGSFVKLLCSCFSLRSALLVECPAQPKYFFVIFFRNCIFIMNVRHWSQFGRCLVLGLSQNLKSTIIRPSWELADLQSKPYITWCRYHLNAVTRSCSNCSMLCFWRAFNLRLRLLFISFFLRSRLDSLVTSSCWKDFGSGRGKTFT